MFAKKENKIKGDFGERLAVKYLKGKGYKIIETNFRLRSGEIDIIAKDGDYIVFAEVKFRENNDYGEPCEAVGYRKQRKIINTAKAYIQKNEIYDFGFRFDGIEILNADKSVRHIINAFEVF